MTKARAARASAATIERMTTSELVSRTHADRMRILRRARFSGREWLMGGLHGWRRMRIG